MPHLQDVEADEQPLFGLSFGDRLRLDVPLRQELTFSRNKRGALSQLQAAILPYSCGGEEGGFKIGAYPVSMGPIWRSVWSVSELPQQYPEKKKNVLIILQPYGPMKSDRFETEALSGVGTYLYTVTCWRRLTAKAIGKCLKKVIRQFLPAEASVYVASSQKELLIKFVTLAYKSRNEMRGIDPFLVSWLARAPKFKYILTGQSLHHT